MKEYVLRIGRNDYIVNHANMRKHLTAHGVDYAELWDIKVNHCIKSATRYYDGRISVEVIRDREVR